MHFRFLSSVRDLLLRLDGVIEMDIGGLHGIRLLFRRPTPEEHAAGHGQLATFCDATCTWNPSGKLQGMFADLGQRKMPSGWNREFAWQSQVEEDGRFKDRVLPRAELFPQAFQDFARGVRAELGEACERAVSLMRWRYYATGPHNQVGAVDFSWSVDGTTWNRMPFDGNCHVEATQGVYPGGTTATTVAALMTQGRAEPVGHELFREAWFNRHSHPRSSLLIGIAAAEVAFKECVADLVPGAAWVVENAPTPPLVNMLTDYLPHLPARCAIGGKAVSPPKAITDTLKKGVLLRNKVTHTGADAPKYDTLEEVLQAVKDVLWLLDYYRGDEWALEHVRPEVRTLMGAS